MSNITISNITGTNRNYFMFVSLDSILELTNIIYESSEVALFNVRTSVLNLEGLTVRNIHNASNIYKVASCGPAKISNIDITNSSTTEGRLMSISNSLSVTLSSITASNIAQIVLFIEGSAVNEIDQLNIIECFGGLYIQDSVVSNLTNSLFRLNGNLVQLKGGAVYLHNSEVLLHNSKFISNIATAGGAVYFDCTSLSKCHLRILNCEMSSNTATREGGAIYYGYKRPEISEVVFSNNIAPYGNDIASYAVKLKFNNTISDEMTISEVGSGIIYPKPLNIALVDADNQVMVLNNENQVLITSTNASVSSVAGVISALLKNGIATFESLIGVAQPGSTHIAYQVTSKAIDREKLAKIYGIEGTNTLNMNFRFCKPGEIQFENNRCSKCGVGAYSLSWNATQCLK